MMQTNRQWVNADRRSPEYIDGMQPFLEVAKANKNQRDSCVVHAHCAEMTKTTLTGGLFTST
jgi:hypothetical protein